MDAPASADIRPATLADRPDRRAVGQLAVSITLVCLVVGYAHRPALRAEAVCADDTKQVLTNRLVQKPGWTSIKRLFGEVLEPSSGGYYKPLSMVSLMLDRYFAGRGDSLEPFRKTSLALHVLNTALVTLFLYLLFRHVWPAALVGLLFGVHPVTVEAIPWAAERKNLLSAFFALLSLVLYVRFARRRTVTAYAAALCTFILALLSKPTIVALPLLLLLIDYWPLRRLSRRTILEKVPFFILAGLSAIITLVSQSRAAGVALHGAQTPLPDTSLRIPLTVCHNIVFYLWKFIWPANLTAYYPYPEPFDLTHPAVIAGIAGTVLLLAALALSLRRTRAFVVGWLFFFVAILPAIGIIGFTNTIAADRFLYFPAVGFLLVITWAACKPWEPQEGTKRGTAWRVVVVAIAGLFTVAESLATRNYLAKWTDSETLHRYMLAKAPDAAELHDRLGNVLYEQARRAREAGDHDTAAKKLNEALAEYGEALRLEPGYGGAHKDMGRALMATRQFPQAAGAYSKALRALPSDPGVHTGLGKAVFAQFEQRDRQLHDEGKDPRRDAQWNLLLGSAIASFQKAVELRADYADAHNMLGVAVAYADGPEAAIPHFKAAVRSDPELIDAHQNLAQAYFRLSRFGDAIRALRQVMRRDPDNAGARQLLRIAQQQAATP